MLARRSTIPYVDSSGGPLNFVMRGWTPGDCEVSPGCMNCYVMRLQRTFPGFLPEHTTYDQAKVQKLLALSFPPPYKRGEGSKPLAFVVDLGDLFHPNVSADFILYAFDIMESRKDVDWIVLTKRPERMVEVLFGAEGHYYLGSGDYLPNVILGVTAEDQERANQRIPLLLGNWMGPTMVSVEPMLGPVDLTDIRYDRWTEMNVLEGCGLTTRPGYMGQSIPNCYCPKLGWVIVGGESGPSFRPLDHQWVEDLYRQCEWAGIPCFLKQDAGIRPGLPLLLEGKQIQEWPKRW